MTEETQLPAGWKKKTIADLYLVIGGGTPSTNNSEYWKGDIPWITSADIYGLMDIRPRKQITEAAIESSATNLIPAGSLIVVTRVALGKVALTQYPICYSQDSQGLIAKDDSVLPKYALYYLSQAVQVFKYVSRGTTISGVTKRQLKDLDFPLPPLAEQERIVAKIEALFSQLEAGVAALRRAQAALKRYRASLLKAACEGRLAAQDPSDAPAEAVLQRLGKSPLRGEGLPVLPPGWCWVRLGEIAKIETGATPLRSKSKYWENGNIPWITSGAVNDLQINHAEEFITEIALNETNVKIFPAGSLLIAMYGEGKTRGKISELLINAATNQACAALIFNDLNTIFKSYIKLFFQSNYEEIRRLSSGGVQPNLNLSIIKNTFIPLPPLAEQERIVAELERRLTIVAQVETAIQTGLARSARLRQAILKQAFRGEL